MGILNLSLQFRHYLQGKERKKNGKSSRSLSALGDEARVACEGGGTWSDPPPGLGLRFTHFARRKNSFRDGNGPGPRRGRTGSGTWLPGARPADLVCSTYHILYILYIIPYASIYKISRDLTGMGRGGCHDQTHPHSRSGWRGQIYWSNPNW